MACPASTPAPEPVQFRLFDPPQCSLLPATREAIVIIDGSHRIAAVNPAAEQLFGQSSARLVGEPVDILIPPSRRDAHLAQASRDVFGLHADGSEIPVRASRGP